MAVLAWTLGALGGLSAVMGIIVATDLINEVAGLEWMFWMVLGGILLLGSIAAAVGRSGEYE